MTFEGFHTECRGHPAVTHHEFEIVAGQIDHCGIKARGLEKRANSILAVAQFASCPVGFALIPNGEHGTDLLAILAEQWLGRTDRMDVAAIGPANDPWRIHDSRPANGLRQGQLFRRVRFTLDRKKMITLGIVFRDDIEFGDAMHDTRRLVHITDRASFVGDDDAFAQLIEYGSRCDLAEVEDGKRCHALPLTQKSFGCYYFVVRTNPQGNLLVHIGEEVLVGLRILHLVEEEFHRVDRAHLHENSA